MNEQRKSFYFFSLRLPYMCAASFAPSLIFSLSTHHKSDAATLVARVRHVIILLLEYYSVATRTSYCIG